MRYIPCGDARGPSLGYAGTVLPTIDRNPPQVAKSWAPEVVADDSGEFIRNSMRFSTEDQAERTVRALAASWRDVTEFRVVETSDAVNARWDEMKGLVFI